MKAETTLDQARAELTVIARNIEQSNPATNKGWSITVDPMQAAVVGADLRTTSLVLGGGLKLTAIGVAIGVAASALLVRSLAALLFGVPPLDPLTFVMAPLALTLVALLACLAPAIRALRVDPIAALRTE